MKILTRFLINIILLSILIMDGYQCTTEEKKDCTDKRNPKWDNIQPYYWSYDSSSQLAYFKYDVSITNVCIEQLANISVTIDEKPGSKISKVVAWTMVPNSTDLPYFLDQLSGSLYKNFDLDVRQGFNQSPGSFVIEVRIYVIADSESEATYNYNESVSDFYISIVYYNYNP